MNQAPTFALFVVAMGMFIVASYLFAHATAKLLFVERLLKSGIEIYASLPSGRLGPYRPTPGAVDALLAEVKRSPWAT